MNYYDLLEVSRTASPQVMTAAYRAKAKVLHPDAVPPDERQSAEEQFKLLNEAYTVLSDPEQRALYDEYLKNPVVEPAPSVPASPSRSEPATDSSDTIVKYGIMSVIALLVCYLAFWPAREAQKSPSSPAASGQGTATPQVVTPPPASPPPSREGEAEVNMEWWVDSIGILRVKGAIKNNSNYKVSVLSLIVEGLDTSKKVILSMKPYGKSATYILPGESIGFEANEYNPPPGLRWMQAVPSFFYIAP